MKLSRILVTGAAGFLGWNVARYFHSKGRTVVGAWHQREPDPSFLRRDVRMDLAKGDHRVLFDTAAEAPDALAAGACVDALVHCAALSSRIDCESDPARARAVNVDASRRLAEMARERGIHFVFISTDLVFDGDNPPYWEDDAPSPISLYGETKAEAEKAILAVHPESYIIRTALMYGNGPGGKPGSFLAWTLDALRKQQPLHLYTNQYRNPLNAPDVARFIDLLLSHGAAPGIYHAAGPDRLSRFEIGHRIAAAFGLPADCIIASKVDRPVGLGPIDDCSLLIAKADAIGMRFTGINEGLRVLR
ncbi:MAG: SDR family oxidoreductase [Bacteroidetes bacterium]|nr:SDR family oxidoreductase [Bacteroidota bacterium]